jgi:Mlc titration factor MtfA (ptsG expression regulator)
MIFGFFRDWLDRRIIRRSAITPSQWDDAFALLPLLHGLSAEEKQTLRELAILFLHRKSLEGVYGLAITQSMALLIALQACLPVLKLGLQAYDGWYSVIVYPGGFAPERVVVDEYGVEHRGQSDLLGESWQRGPVVLAWDATEAAGAIDGHNLVIHEFAHKLDMQTGSANGYPPLHRGMDHQAWVSAFTAGYADFQRRCDSRQHLEIDCYAATAPAEFFAVLSEVFFERPGVIRRHYPAIYEQLRQYYRQDPATRLGKHAH